MGTPNTPHRELVNSVSEMTGLGKLDIFERAFIKHTQGQDDHCIERARQAYMKFEYNGKAPQCVLTWCVNASYPKPKKKLRKMQRLARKIADVP